MAAKHELTRDDVIAMADYARERKDRRRALVAAKRHRRLEVGPDCTFYFENYETMWNQVHEMLFIEKGGEDQIADELRAYNPLIPKGRELVATVMFEIDDPARRAVVLAKLGGIEETAFLRLGGETIRGACPRPTWSEPARPARPPRSSSSTSPSPTNRWRRSAGPAPRGAPRAVPRSWSASPTPNTPTWRHCPNLYGRRWPRTSTEGESPARALPVPLDRPLIIK